MSIKVTMSGLGEVTFESVAEFLEVKRAAEAEARAATSAPALGVAPVPAPMREEPPMAARRAGPSSIQGSPREAATLIDLLAVANNGAVPAAQIAAALKIGHPKGLGVVLARVNQAISDVGMNPAEVITSRRTSKGREYRGGPKLRDAMYKFEQLRKR